MIPFPRTWLTIRLDHLAHNLGEVRAHLGERTRLGLVAKADAYGHGLVPVGRHAVAHGADWLCVATVQEGIALRDAGIGAPILVLSPILPLEAEQAVFYGLRVSVECFETIEALSQAAVAQSKTALVHIEVDTGLSRFGCGPLEARKLLCAGQALPGIEIEGLSQHFVDSGNDPAETERQATEFWTLVDQLAQAGIRPPIVHACNSAGILRAGQVHGELVRTGIYAYGVDPYTLGPISVRPVMSWTARVTALRTVPAGTGFSYAGTQRATRQTRVATLGVGYGDGYPRSLSRRGVVEIHGKEAPVLGLVCMDQLLVDVTDIPEVQLGDDAQLIGEKVTVTRLAELAETNPHEIVTRIMSRVPRRYVR